MKPAFLNVDLLIESATPLDGLAAAMGEKVMVLYLGRLPRRRRHLLVVEAAQTRLRTPNAMIHKLCEIMEKLPLSAKRIWRNAKRTFDLGYQLVPFERSFQISLRDDTVQRVAKLGACFIVTCYKEPE